MGLLACCWLIIESKVIPDGYYLKWFYLSFYIHSVFLFACQIFLWLKVLQRCIVAVIMYPFRIISIVCSYVYRFCRYCFIYIFSFIRVTNLQAAEEIGSNLDLVKRDSSLEAVDDSPNQLLSLSICSSIAPVACKSKVVEVQRDEILPERENSHMEDWSFCLHKDLSADEYSASVCISSPSIDEEYLNEYSPLFSSFRSPFMKEYSSPPAACRPGSPVLEREVITTAIDEVESEEFYKKYSERMGWFDVLIYERTCGISEILNEEVGILSSLDSLKAKDFSIPYISWSKIDKKMLLRSFQSDFELVYVAQSCLTWEALHHQYRKVKFLTFSNSLFHYNVAGEFQNFQVLLERFLEDERCYRGKRVWNYVQARLTFKSLLQVPEVSGCFEEEKEGSEGETVHAKDALKAIEKCIQAFGKFVITDRKRPWWKFQSSLWTYPPVENPADLELLADLTRRLQKKELWLKDLQGKQRCWFNKAVNHHPEESQKEGIFFAMIEMKLVSRVLQMSILSSSQLKWCQEKLDSIEFIRGRLFRTAGGPLFPSS